jgi:hypothetical protein
LSATLYTDAGPSSQRSLDYPLALGDFDGDGNLDIALANNVDGGMSAGSVAIFFGVGDGTFDAVIQYGSTAEQPNLFYSPVNVFAVSLGSPPGTALIVSDVGPTPDDSRIEVVRVAPDRSLNLIAEVPTVPLSEGSGSLTAVDLTGDGIPDFIVGGILHNNDHAALQTLLGGDGGSWSPKTYLEYSDFQNGITGDFNEDGRPDLIAAPIADDHQLVLLLGNGDGTFSEWKYVGSASLDSEAFLIGDLNEDGHLDVLLDYGWSWGIDLWSVLLGQGDGTFTIGPSVSIGAVDVPTGLQDVNGDGHLDFVGSAGLPSWGGTGIRIALGNGDGTFQPWFDLPMESAGESGLAVGDVNNDGRPDLVAADLTGKSVSIYLNNCR